MAFGAGVLISAVAYDLTAEAFDLGGGDAVAIGLAAGALVYAGLSRLLNRHGQRTPRAPAGRSPWAPCSTGSRSRRRSA